MSSSSATDPRSRELPETRDNAVVAVQRILAANESQFDFVSFLKYNAVSKLRPQNYNGYFVVCHINTLRSAGWLLCRYALNGGCTLEKSLYSFKTIQGGTSRLERQTKRHRSGSATLNFQRNLPSASRGNLATTAAALAVCLDFRPLSYCDGHPGLVHFGKSIFELG